MKSHFTCPTDLEPTEISAAAAGNPLPMQAQGPVPVDWLKTGPARTTRLSVCFPSHGEYQFEGSKFS